MLREKLNRFGRIALGTLAIAGTAATASAQNPITVQDYQFGLDAAVISGGAALAVVVAAAIGVFIAYAIARRALGWFKVGLRG